MNGPKESGLIWRKIFPLRLLTRKILSFAVLRNDCLIRIICGGKDRNKGVSMRRRLLGNYDGEIHVGL